MRFCFLLDEAFIDEPTYVSVIDQLQHWGHEVDILHYPQMPAHPLDISFSNYDLFVLKTLNLGGSEMALLEEAETLGLPTINNSYAHSLLRDRKIALDHAGTYGLPVLTKNSSYQANVYHRQEGSTTTLYVTGQEVHTVIRESLIDAEDEKEIVTTQEMLTLAQQIRELFQLDLYSIDLEEHSHGFSIIDLHNFPTFYGIPGSTSAIAEYILHLAYHYQQKREGEAGLSLRKRAVINHEPLQLMPARLRRHTHALSAFR